MRSLSDPRGWVLAGAILLIGLVLPLAARAAEPPARHALVLANSDYPGTERDLPNPVHDATLMGQTLRKLGFQVSQHLNLPRADMHVVVREFAARLPAGATALVFYAGHGMQIGGANYLIPVDMQVTGEQSVPLKAYPVKSLLDQLAASRAAVNLVVLDACRNNPFQPAGAVRYRSYANLGLAPVQAPRGTLIAYSTAPGQLAADGKEGNSLYVATLSKALLEPGIAVEPLFKRVGDQVRRRTLDDQIPWFESSLTEEFFFQPPEGVRLVAGKSLRTADAPAATALRRDWANETWFAGLDAQAWGSIDQTLRERLQRMTEDDLPLLRHQAEGGSLMAQTQLGLWFLQGGKSALPAAEAPTPQALTWLTRAADAGFPPAQQALGEMLAEGRGTERDIPQARRWMEAAAKQGFPRAALGLRVLRMTREDGSLSLDWLRPTPSDARQ